MPPPTCRGVSQIGRASRTDSTRATARRRKWLSHGPMSFADDRSAASVVTAVKRWTLPVSFTPTDAANYNGAAKDVTINVLKGTPVITWANPAPITYPAALGATQLNATADVPGSF